MIDVTKFLPNIVTILFDIENKETFKYDAKRDSFVCTHYPERFRIATAEDLTKYPLQ